MQPADLTALTFLEAILDGGQDAIRAALGTVDDPEKAAQLAAALGGFVLLAWDRGGLDPYNELARLRRRAGAAYS